MRKKVTYMTGLAALVGLFAAVSEAQTAKGSLPPVEIEPLSQGTP
ncbi:MAG: hypothetical protein OXP74_11285 [Acidobacteriota bacterium]|nr:hypothetical protein [Acidobacteriota bacterium]